MTSPQGNKINSQGAVLSLTKKQAECLAFVSRTIQENGVAPSYQEIADELGLASKSGVHRLIEALIYRGHLVRAPNRARSLSLPAMVSDETKDAALMMVLKAVDRGVTGKISRIAALEEVREIASRARAGRLA